MSSGSSSPQWDNRHRGFISPAELQQLRQASPGRGTDLHEFHARQPATSTPADQNPSAGAVTLTSQQEDQSVSRPTTNTMSHTRTSSFFSFRKQLHSSDANDHQQQSSRRPSTGASDRDFAPQNNQQRAQTMGPLRSSPEKFSLEKQDDQESDTALAARRESTSVPPLHPEIRSIVQLTVAHARKVYFSGPLVKRVQRQPDGQRPKDDGWVDVWAQLSGTTLSIWDMKEIEAANKKGLEVPPTYVNITDAFVHVLGSVTGPAETPDSPRKTYSNVLTLNTAGSNLLLFSCPSIPALESWATALRLSAWEKSRLEEMYTAHLIRITLLEGKDTRTTLVRGRMEGWVLIRVAGQTDWKRLWMVISGSQSSGVDPGALSTTTGTAPTPKKRMSNLFSRDHSPEPLPVKPLLALYATPRPKDKKHPLLTLREVSQAFAVYPERPELINRSTLMKLEGLIGDEEMAGTMKRREGWLLIMPELEAGNTQASEMLKWLVALHDAFELYGRPKVYTWDPRDPVSLMFAYPVNPGRDLLFLDREVAESMDPRDDRTSAIRNRLLNILFSRMPELRATSAPPPLPPMALGADPNRPPQQQPSQNVAQPRSQTQNGQPGYVPQLPTINFDLRSPPDLTVGHALSPITERSVTRETFPDFPHTQSRSMSNEHHGPESMMISRSMSSEQPDSLGQSMSSGHQDFMSRSMSEHSQSQMLSPLNSLNPVLESVSGSITALPLTGSPPPTLRPESRPTPSLETMQTRSTEPSTSASVDVGGFRLPLTPESPGSPTFSTSSTSPSSGIGRPTSPGMSLSALVAPVPIRSPVSRSPPPISRPISILTSPYSPKGKDKELPSIQDVQDALQLPPRAMSPPHPFITPLHNADSPPLPPKAQSPTPTPRVPVAVATVPVAPTQPLAQDTEIFSDALFYMQQFDEKPKNPPRRVPTTISEASNSDESSASDKALRPSPARRGTPMSFSELGRAEANNSEPSMIGSRPSLGRKPSGARVQPTSSRGPNVEATLVSSPSLEHVHVQAMADSQQKMIQKQNSGDDVNVDALAALSFLDSASDVAPSPAPAHQPPPPEQDVSSEPTVEGSAASESSEGVTQYRSSFAPSKQAAQRKARAQAQHQAVLHKPGRANGKRATPGNRLSGWNESSDEEEEEEEEEDDEDADSDEEPPSTLESKKTGPVAPVPVPAVRPLRPGSAGRAVTPGEQATDANPYAQLRHPRNLPPVPRPMTQGGVSDDYMNAMPPPRRLASDQHMRTLDDAPHLRPQSEYTSQVLRPQADFNQHAAARQSIWTQVLDSGRTPGSHPQPETPSHQRDPFIQLEPASHSMTKAFTPHGLLSAGMQDKQDRSAKRQEELARETGASLINVPNKPPPPQTGLLGAITAHERERKREGGVGAALTERERDKRMAEDRQRKIDDFQRNQLEMQGMYGGGQQYPNMMGNPMMGNPMMMGINPMMTGGNPMMAGPNPMMNGANPMMNGANPMMTGGYMGYPGMMPGFGNPQFFAQQAAQAAYQQAMMAYSSAGSHVGDGMHPTPMNPMMTGGGMGYDPRMSMMGVPMMGNPMGMNHMGGGMGGGMGMGMGGGGMGGGGMGGMAGMGMQMTGGSAFDARYSPANMEDLRPPGSLAQGQRTGHSSSRNSSAGQGSPAGPRPVDARDSPKS
ncbi:hypothetical protein DEU56DRAFT_952095 [Suillus clintonianus]|uniref:uncharacterized protein n=1 Tax=Suillus clintonianus TaxID=1904413 RepID=UPI001B87D813|nr:uncharacterized protein DEU56DRAFT_952095 [Suillus clintonianus]KAG2154048.1 hypothetical protein DEU56DRAFT_952095 [Suillus clintonianus]